MKNTGWWLIAVAVLVAGVTAPSAAEEAAARRVLGTLHVTGTVETADAVGEWKPLISGAALEGMQLRTRNGGSAVIQLASGEKLALGADSACQLGGSDAARVQLTAGRIALRVRSGSSLTIVTPRGVVRAASAKSGAPALYEAMVTVNDGSTAVRTYAGRFTLLANGETEALEVEAGRLATLGDKGGSVELASATNPAQQAATETPIAHAAEGSAFSALGLSPAALALIGGGVVAGGTVGGLAASGEFSSTDTSSEGTGRQGSPFRPDRNK